MKKRRELEVDFIGDQKPLTKSEEKELSEYFRKKKSASRKIGKSKVKDRLMINR